MKLGLVRERRKVGEGSRRPFRPRFRRSQPAPPTGQSHGPRAERGQSRPRSLEAQSPRRRRSRRSMRTPPAITPRNCGTLASSRACASATKVSTGEPSRGSNTSAIWMGASGSSIETSAWPRNVEAAGRPKATVALAAGKALPRYVARRSTRVARPSIAPSVRMVDATSPAALRSRRGTGAARLRPSKSRRSKWRVLCTTGPVVTAPDTSKVAGPTCAWAERFTRGSVP
jgi:hypothetical protein